MQGYDKPETVQVDSRPDILYNDARRQGEIRHRSKAFDRVCQGARVSTTDLCGLG